LEEVSRLHFRLVVRGPTRRAHRRHPETEPSGGLPPACRGCRSQGSGRWGQRPWSRRTHLAQRRPRCTSTGVRLGHSPPPRRWRGSALPQGAAAETSSVSLYHRVRNGFCTEGPVHLAQGCWRPPAPPPPRPTLCPGRSSQHPHRCGASSPMRSLVQEESRRAPRPRRGATSCRAEHRRSPL